MATKYSDIITIRGQRAAYNIKNEDKNNWKSFIPNDQFNSVLQKVIASVRNNDIDMHKSFWMEGFFGTGKSHAGAVIMHLLCDPLDEITDWLNGEYAESDLLRNDLIVLRKNKRLFPVMLYGQQSITHEDDLSLQLQREITQALKTAGITVAVKTDFENYVEHINSNPDFWDNLIAQNAQLKSIAPLRQKLVKDLQDGDTATLDKVRVALRERQFDIRLTNNNLPQWIFEVQQQLSAQGIYDGLFIIWDEFTDVMNSVIGLRLLTILQEVNEILMKPESNSYFFYIMHPNALNTMRPEERQKTKGRYLAMTYNMETVSAFKILTRKFQIKEENRQEYEDLYNDFYVKHPNLLDVYTQDSTNKGDTINDLCHLFPLHPSTANLATFYANHIGAKTRTIFQFIGENQSIKDFLDSEENYKNADTITADYLWDAVLDEFNSDSKYGAVMERFNSHKLHVEEKGENANSVFKGILLLNALNNFANFRNATTISPSEENIRYLFEGTRIENDLTDILSWLDNSGIVQRQPDGLFSILFTALPTKEIEDVKQDLLDKQFKFTHQIVNFNETASREIEKLFFKGVNRPFRYKLFSTDSNEHLLLNKIENSYKEIQPYELFFAFMFARNNQELNELKTIAEKAKDENQFKYVTFVVFDAVFGDKNYERFIEYQANATVALKHNYADQQQNHIKNASEMVRTWISEIRRSNFTYYLQGNKDSNTAIKMTSTINACVGPTIFSNGPESLGLIQQNNSQTYWKKEKKEKLVNNVLQYNTKSEIIKECAGPNRHVEFLLQDSVDENLEWKSDVDKEHPLYIISSKIKSTFDHINKNDQFNLGEKLEYLTHPPYGLFMSAAGMGMVAFAMRRYVKQIFDLNGKPRDQKQLADDIVEMFKSWDANKSSNKLNFRFETKETRKLCDSLVKMFKLNQLPKYSDISSLTDARWAILHAYSDKQGYPLWALKYFANSDQEKVNPVIDNIIKICNEADVRNPDLINNTLDGISDTGYGYELRNVLNTPGVFSLGFTTFLKQVEMVNLKDEEVEEAKNYLKKHLQSEVGLWSESEVTNQLKNWRLEQEKPKEVEITAGVYPYGSGQVIGVGKYKVGQVVKLAAMPSSGFEFECWQGIDDKTNPLIISAEYTMEFTARFKPIATKPQLPKKLDQEKKQSAIKKVQAISSVDKAKSVLERIIDIGDEVIINIIESEL